MQDPGYQWVPVHDPSAGHGLEVAQQNGQYRMKFRASDDVAITIDVHIRISDNVTGFYYHDAGTDAPDVSSQSRYQKLRERMALEFGADNVSEGHSFFYPLNAKRLASGICQLQDRLYWNMWQVNSNNPTERRPPARASSG